MISDFKAGAKICQSVLLRVQRVGTSSNGAPFARGLAEDNSGKIPFITFEAGIVEKMREMDGPSPVMVSGSVDINKFSGEMALQLVIKKLSDIVPEDDISNLLPEGDFDHEAYKEKFDRLIKSVLTPGLRLVLDNVFEGAVYEQFLRNPAGMRLHHAYIGGLLQHSVDVAVLATAMAESIGGVDKDLIVAGALLHDVGKLREISASMGFPYTTEGRLLGHISMSAAIVQEAAAKARVTGPKLQQLLHIILSHHGEPEKGSPVACATKEAFVVHYADELDAVMNQFKKTDNKNPWEYNKMLQRFLMSNV